MRKVFAKIHYEMNYLFKYLNQRLSTGHYTANESRELIKWISEIEELKNTFNETEFKFNIDPYYEKIISKCNVFLQESMGSPIPLEFEKIILKIIEPIFILDTTITVFDGKINNTYPIELIGGGSYANVFKYKDEYYNKYFAIKRAYKDLNSKEHTRFKREYEEMKKLNSPYVVEVYRYDDDKSEYTMEYIDQTLNDYIKYNNDTLSKDNRRNIVLQILKAFKYIHSQGLLHRDISLTNILIKKYEKLIVVKVSDFGLVKIKNSNLTSVNTEFKGSLNDPNLRVIGFDNYDMYYETYALTRVIYFVMTGKTNIYKEKNEFMKQFLAKGLNPNTKCRYKDIDELRKAYIKLFNNME